MDIEVRPIAASRIGERDLSPQSFGTVFCDHMLVAEYRDGVWTDARIELYGRRLPTATSPRLC
jgi:branched-chain amino acid aminotransferase